MIQLIADYATGTVRRPTEQERQREKTGADLRLRRDRGHTDPPVALQPGEKVNSRPKVVRPERAPRPALLCPICRGAPCAPACPNKKYLK